MDAAQVPGIGWEALALSFGSLGLVCLVAWGALRLLAGRGVGKGVGAVRVLARCPLEPRRSVYVIEAAGRTLLVGVGEGAMSLLAELDPAKLPAAVTTPRQTGFAEVLARVLRRPASGVVEVPPEAP